MHGQTHQNFFSLFALHLLCPFLLCGMLAFQDYGIGWDDEFARVLTGRVNLNYITNLDKTTLLFVAEKYHGPFFEILLACMERGFKMTDTANIYRMRHLVLFLVFFMALIAFYKTAIKVVGKEYALMACLFLVLSPRIFAESFYNSKDLVFMSFSCSTCIHLFNSLKNEIGLGLFYTAFLPHF